jgi:hypothetical protein
LAGPSHRRVAGGYSMSLAARTAVRRVAIFRKTERDPNLKEAGFGQLEKERLERRYNSSRVPRFLADSAPGGLLLVRRAGVGDRRWRFRSANQIPHGVHIGSNEKSFGQTAPSRSVEQQPLATNDSVDTRQAEGRIGPWENLLSKSLGPCR